MKKIIGLILLTMLSMTLLNACGDNSSVKNINIQNEAELTQAKKERELLYQEIKTPEQAVELYDCKEFEQTWEKSEGGILFPPSEVCFKGGTFEYNDETVRHLFYPFKFRGKLYMLGYLARLDGRYYNPTGSRVIYTLKDIQNDNGEYDWTLDQDWSKITTDPVGHRKLIITGRVTEPMWDILAKTEIYDKWAKDVDAKNEEALRKIISKQEQ